MSQIWTGSPGIAKGVGPVRTEESDPAGAKFRLARIEPPEVPPGNSTSRGSVATQASGSPLGLVPQLAIT
jgi:hypothetical protein